MAGSTTGFKDAELTALRRRRIGFVFQSFQLLPTLTALENVELPLLLAGARRIRAKPLANAWSWVGLEGSEARCPTSFPVDRCSASPLRARLSHSPELLIADEPTGNLDTASGDQCLTFSAKPRANSAPRW